MPKQQQSFLSRNGALILLAVLVPVVLFVISQLAGNPRAEDRERDRAADLNRQQIEANRK